MCGEDRGVLGGEGSKEQRVTGAFYLWVAAHVDVLLVVFLHDAAKVPQFDAVVHPS